MKESSFKYHLVNFIIIIAGGVGLSAGAIHNGYPLIAPDSGTYIDSALNEIKLNSVDTIIYSIFIHFLSFKKSLWYVIVFQSIIFSFIIFKFSSLFTNDKNQTYKTFIVVMLVLCFFTGAMWYSSQIMTDIFTSIAFMSFIIIYFKKDLKIFEAIYLSIIIIFSILTHKSHFILFPFFLTACLIIFYFVNRNLKFSKRIFIILAIILISFPANIILNKSFSGEAEMRSSSHIFIMARLNQTNILKKVLEKYCDKKDFCICKYKDDLPVYRGVFKWNRKKSPIYNCGNWQNTKEEFNEVIKLSFSTPRLIFWQINDALQATGQQLIDFRIGRLFTNQSNSFAARIINTYFPNEITEFKNSRQNTDKINFYSPSNRQSFILFVSIAGLFLILYYFNNILSKNEKRIIFLTGLFIFSNAVTTAPLAGVSDRYVGRVIWLIALIFVLLFIKYRKKI